MAVTYEPIASHTLTSNATSYTFSNIPGTYTDLVLIAVGESTRTDDARGVRMRFNSDTASNYSNTDLYGTGSTASSSRTSSVTFAEGFLASRSTYSPVVNIGHFMSYANTNVYKTVLLSHAYPAANVQRTVGLWRSTSAITSIEVYVGLNELKSGFTLALYGIKAA